MSRSIRRLVFLLALAVSAAACEGVVDPQHGVTGAYDATTFHLQTPQGTRDLLEEGAQLSIFLHADRSVTGYIFIAGEDEDGGDFSENLTGTWEIVNGHVRLDTEADTFLRQADLRIQENLLIYEQNGLLVVFSPAG